MPTRREPDRISRHSENRYSLVCVRAGRSRAGLLCALPVVPADRRFSRDRVALHLFHAAGTVHAGCPPTPCACGPSISGASKIPITTSAVTAEPEVEDRLHRAECGSTERECHPGLRAPGIHPLLRIPEGAGELLMPALLSSRSIGNTTCRTSGDGRTSRARDMGDPGRPRHGRERTAAAWTAEWRRVRSHESHVLKRTLRGPPTGAHPPPG
jgi:hypothetical protein